MARHVGSCERTRQPFDLAAIGKSAKLRIDSGRDHTAAPTGAAHDLHLVPGAAAAADDQYAAVTDVEINRQVFQDGLISHRQFCLL